MKFSLKKIGFNNRLDWGFKAFKLSFALVLTNITTKFLVGYNPAWIMVSIVVVMLAHETIQLQYQRAISRIMATILGGACASIVMIIHLNETINTILIISLVFLFSWARSKKLIKDYTFILGLVTYFIIVSTKNPNLLYALDRFTEVLIGILIAMITTNIIFPVSIKSYCKIIISNQWKIMHNYAQIILLNQKTRANKDPEIYIIQEKILNNQQKIVNIFKEKKKKRKTFKTFKIIKRINEIQLGIYRHLTNIDCVKFLYGKDHNVLSFKNDINLIVSTIRDLSDPQNLYDLSIVDVKNIIDKINLSSQTKHINEHYSLNRIENLLKEAIILTKKIYN